MVCFDGVCHYQPIGQPAVVCVGMGLHDAVNAGVVAVELHLACDGSMMILAVG